MEIAAFDFLVLLELGNYFDSSSSYKTGKSPSKLSDVIFFLLFSRPREALAAAAISYSFAGNLDSSEDDLDLRYFFR